MLVERDALHVARVRSIVVALPSRIGYGDAFLDADARRRG